MERTENRKYSVYFVFHGACPDGFYAALVWDLFRQACAAQKVAFHKAIEDAFCKPFPGQLTFDPEDAVASGRHKSFEGQVDRTCEQPQDYDDVSYFPVIHTTTARDIQRVLRCAEKKDIAVIADIGNLEVVNKLHSSFEQIYFLDHHLTALTEGLSNPEFVKKYPNVKYFYEHKHSACKLLYNLLYPTGVLQAAFSPKFGANLTFMVDSISLGDVNSAVNLPLHHRRIKNGICSLSDINNFSKNLSVQHLRKIADYSYETLEKLGAEVLVKMEKEIYEEIKKAKVGNFSYQSKSNNNQTVAITFLMLHTKSKYRSEIGNYLSAEAKKQGLDPIGMVYVNSNSEDTFKASWRALDDNNNPNINMMEICGLFGGGGHRLASGCELSDQDIRRMLAGKKPAQPTLIPTPEELDHLYEDLSEIGEKTATELQVLPLTPAEIEQTPADPIQAPSEPVQPSEPQAKQAEE